MDLEQRIADLEQALKTIKGAGKEKPWVEVNRVYCDLIKNTAKPDSKCSQNREPLGEEKSTLPISGAVVDSEALRVEIKLRVQEILERRFIEYEQGDYNPILKGFLPDIVNEIANTLSKKLSNRNIATVASPQGHDQVKVQDTERTLEQKFQRFWASDEYSGRDMAFGPESEKLAQIAEEHNKAKNLADYKLGFECGQSHAEAMMQKRFEEAVCLRDSKFSPLIQDIRIALFTKDGK